MATPPASANAKRVIRIVSKCSSEDEFAALFGRFVDRESIFIVTRKPKPLGAKSQFFITLADGEPVLSGRGEVVEAITDKSGKFKRPGMRIRFESLEPTSRALLERMVNGASAAPPPLPPLPKHLRPTPPKTPEIAPSSAEKAATEEAQAAAEAISAAEHSNERTPGATTVLPANPFGELTEAALEAFIECSMYEESGAIQLAEEDRDETCADLLPGWWPRDDEDSTAGDGSPPGAPGSPPSGVANATPPPPGSDQLTRPRPPTMPLDSAGPYGQAAQGYTPPPGAAAGLRQAEPTELVYRPLMPPLSRTSATKQALIAAGIASMLSLGIGYALWGGGDSPDQQEPGVAGKTGTAKNGGGNKAAKPDTDKPKPDADKTKPDTHKPKPDTHKPKPDADEPKPDTDEPKPDADKPKPDADKPKPDADKPPDTDKPPDADKPPAAIADDKCHLEVTSRPSGSTLRRNGTKLGVTPFKGEVSCGGATLVVTRPRYRRVYRKILVKVGKTTTVRVRMQRPVHRLYIRSSPSRASVYVSGRRVGKAPVTAKVPGFERISVVVLRRGYKRWARRVYVNKKRHSVRARLKRRRR